MFRLNSWVLVLLICFCLNWCFLGSGIVPLVFFVFACKWLYIYIYIYISDKVKSIAEKFRGSISTLKYIYRPASEIVKKLTSTQMVSSHHISKVCSDQKGGARLI